MSAVAVSDWKFDFSQFFKLALLLLLAFLGGLLSIMMPLKLFLVVAPAAAIILVLAIRFEWAVFPVLLLVPIASRSLGIAYKAPWNFMVQGRPIDVLGFYMPFVVVAFAGLLIRLLSRSRLPGENIRSKNALAAPMLIILGYSVITLVTTNFPEHGFFQMYVLLLNVAMLILMLFSVRDEAFHKKVMWFWVAVGVVYALATVALYAVRMGDLLFDKEISGNLHFIATVLTGGKNKGIFVRRGNAFNTPNETAFMLNMVFPVAFGLFMAEVKRFRKWLLMLAMFIIASGMLLAMSRAGIGAFIVMIFAMLFIFKRARRYFIALSLVTVIGVVAVFNMESVILQSIFFRGHMETRIAAFLKSQSADSVESSHFLKQRIQLWKRGTKMLKRSSFAGVGIGQYKNFARAPHGHSLVFSTIFDFGLIGLLASAIAAIILLRLFLIYIWRQSTYLQIMGVALLCGLAAIATHGLVDFEYNNPLIWVYLGMTLSTINLIRWEASKRDNSPAQNGA